MPNPNISLIVVVSGQPLSVTVNPNQRVEQLIREALNNSGNHGQPPSEWELRTESGDLIEPSLKIGEAGILEGQTLFLSPRAGVGG